MTLVISPLLISLLVFYVSSSELTATFVSKNVAVQGVESSYDFGFVSLVLNLFGVGVNRAFIWTALFSRNIFTLLFGDPGATLFSVMRGGTQRGGVEGFFSNLIMNYGFSGLESCTSSFAKNILSRREKPKTAQFVV